VATPRAICGKARSPHMEECGLTPLELAGPWFLHHVGGAPACSHEIGWQPSPIPVARGDAGAPGAVAQMECLGVRCRMALCSLARDRMRGARNTQVSGSGIRYTTFQALARLHERLHTTPSRVGYNAREDAVEPVIVCLTVLGMSPKSHLPQLSQSGSNAVVVPRTGDGAMISQGSHMLDTFPSTNSCAPDVSRLSARTSARPQAGLFCL